jgi:hypothetical protein
MNKQFYQSSNFWQSLVMIIGGLFVGFPAEAAGTIVLQIFEISSGGSLIRNWLKSPGKPDFKNFIKDSNTWQYLSVLLIGIFPALPGDLIEEIGQAAQAAIGNNWQLLFASAVAAFNIILKLIRKNAAA